MKKPSTCKWCGTEVRHRPYSGRRDMPSVTTISELVDDGKSRSFAWSASLIAATTAVHEHDRWDGLVGLQSDRALKNGHDGECIHEKEGLCKACEFLRSEFDRQWTAKADLGTHVHHLVESLIHDENVDADETSWGYLDAFDSFVATCDPEWIVTEATILRDTDKYHSYRGQLDGICWLHDPATGARERWLIDWKTGGFYPESQALQLSAYRYATSLTDWSSGEEVKTGPVPTVDRGGVVLLDAEGNFALRELPIHLETHGTFLRLIDVWHWRRRIEREAKSNPLAHITNTYTTPEGANAA